MARRQKRGPFVLKVKLPPAPFSTTYGWDFTLPLFIAERQAGKLWIPTFIAFGLNSQPYRESNQRLLFQQQML